MTDLITVINPDDKQPIQIKSSDLESAMKDGAELVPQISKADLDGKGNAFVIDPETKKTISVPVDKVSDALADGGRLASTWNPNKIQTYNDLASKNKLNDNPIDFSKIQDDTGKYILKDGAGNIYHLPQDQALRHLQTNHFQFADSDFQAMVDSQRETKSNFNDIASWTRGARSSIPIIGSLINKFGEYKTEQEHHIPIKAAEIADKLNEQDTNSSEEVANKAGKISGTIASVAGAFTPIGLVGEGLLASKATSILSPIASKALTGAAQGAAYSLPYVADQLINNQPGKAAETALLSIGVGALLHTAPFAFNGIMGQRVANAQLELPGAASSVLESAGLKAEPNAPFVRDLLKVAPKLENVETGLKSLAAGDHLTETLSKLNNKIDIFPIISKIESLGYKTGASEEINSELTKILHSIEDKSANQQISLLNLQKASKELVSSIDFGSKIPSELANIRISALDHISQSLLEAGDASLAKVVELGEPKAAKLMEAWEQGKQSQSSAQELLSEGIKGKTSAAPAELSNLGQIIKNVYSQTGSNLQAKIQNPGQSLLNMVPGVRSLTSAPSILANATKAAIESRSASFDTWLASHPNSWLIKNIDNPKIGTFIALDALASNNAKLAEIPEFLKNIAQKAPSIFMQNKDPISKILGSEASGLSKDQQLQKLSDKVALLSANPELSQQKTKDLVQPFATDHPEMALAALQLAQNKINYINQLLHGQNKIQEQSPAFQDQKKSNYSASQIKDIKEQLAAIENPYILLHGLQTGLVSQKQVQAVAATSPAIYQEIQQAMNKEAYNGKSKLNYQQRISASLIMGKPLDPSLNNNSLQLQGLLASQNQNNQPAAPAEKKSSKPKLNSNKLPSYQTVSQRISNA